MNKCTDELCSHQECATIRRNKRRTETLLLSEFERFTKTIGEAERADFFDPRNRDSWMAGFGEFLSKPKEFSSND